VGPARLVDPALEPRGQLRELSLHALVPLIRLIPAVQGADLGFSDSLGSDNSPFRP
jgi:hypothetical protein